MTYLNVVLEYFDLAKNYRNYQLILIKNFIKNKILEVGPGRGEIINNFVHDSNKEIVLSEINQDMCDFLKKKFYQNRNLEVLNSRIENIDKKFDTILYMDVIEHMENHEEEIINAFSKLNKNGYLVFIVPAFQHLYTEFDSAVGHYRRYEKKFFKDFGEKNEMKCVKLKYFDSCGYLLLLLSKLFNFKQNKTVTIGIKIWNILIPLSKILDKILLNSFGKSVVCVYQKN